MCPSGEDAQGGDRETQKGWRKNTHGGGTEKCTRGDGGTHIFGTDRWRQGRTDGHTAVHIEVMPT